MSFAATIWGKNLAPNSPGAVKPLVLFLTLQQMTLQNPDPTPTPGQSTLFPGASVTHEGIELQQ